MVRIAAFVVGPLVFWLPALLVEISEGPNYSVTAVNVAALVCLLVAFALLRRWQAWGSAATLYMLAGIYAFGLTFMSIASSHFGGGFAAFNGGAGPFWFVIISVFPPLTWVAAIYDGTIFALLAATAVLLWVGLKGSPAAHRAWRRYIGRPERN